MAGRRYETRAAGVPRLVIGCGGGLGDPGEHRVPGAGTHGWWTEEGGAADILAAKTGFDHDTIMTELGPVMMQLTIGRMVEPQEIADAVALLVSPRSASATGAEFAVDGGFLKEL